MSISREVLSTSDLPDLLHNEFFRSQIGEKVGACLLKALGVEAINRLVSRHSELEGAAFARAVLRDDTVGIKYDLRGEENLRLMTQEKGFITVSNHPFGGIDGLLLIAIIASVRDDFKVVVNNILDRISPLRKNWISVSPSLSLDHNAERNIASLIEIARHIKSGHPVGFFPAGTVAKYQIKEHRPVERSWTEISMRIFKALDVPIYPVAFSGHNSPTFYILQTLADTLHGLRLPAEIMNKKGSIVHVTIGKPLHKEDFQRFSSLNEAATFLRNLTLSLINR